MNLIPQVDNMLPAAPKVAVLLNGNAKRVRPALVKRLSRHISSEDIFYSTTLDEARQLCQIIYQREYDIVFTGGGDGTLLQCVTELNKCQKEDSVKRPLPAVGVLHLGTGNAVASVLGAHKKIVPDLIDAQKNQNVRIRPQRWVSVEGQDTPFAGIGYDSLILHHYRKFHDQLKGTPISWFGKGHMGYLLSIALGAIPAALVKKRTHIELINHGDDPAYLIGPQGKYVKEFAPGETMFSGKVTVVGASTVPCFGFGFKMFPFAESGEKMHVRIASISSIEAVMNLPSIWRGTYRSPKVFDFHASRVCVQSATPEPLQIGGDAAGIHREVLLSLSEHTSNIVDFSSRGKHAALPLPSLSRPHFES